MTLRSVVVRTALLVAFAGSAAITAAAAHAKIRLDLPRESLEDSLRAVGKRADLNILIDRTLVAGLTAAPLKGELDVNQAITELLKGTGLRHEFVNDNTVVLARGDSGVPSSNPSQTRTDALTNTDGVGKDSKGAAESGRFQSSRDDQASSAAAPSVGKIEEIVVTAQKREEKLGDVPVPVSVIGAGDLVNNNQTRLQDYYNYVPGLDLSLDNRGAPAIAIRGVTTTIYGNPTVGVTVDDVPFGATTASAFQWGATDFDPNELSRVEVLRGPQGTLYGASSLGGLIKYETIDPSFDGPSGRLQAGLTNVYNGDAPGYSLSGAVNFPLSDTLALRASAFNRLDPGYVTNILTNQTGVNWGDTDGARLSALWRPSSDFSVKFSALIQNGKTYGSPNVESTSIFGDLQQSYVRGSGGYDRELQAYDLILRGKVGLADLTAITGYGISTSSGSFDASPLSFVRGVTQQQFGVSGVAWVENNQTHKLSQEVRLSIPFGSHFDWLLGGFYTHESTSLNGGFQAFQPETGTRAGIWMDQYGPVTYREYAAFTDLTFHLNDRFDVQFGGRESRNKQTYSQILAGTWAVVVQGLPSPIVTPETESNDNSFTYLVTPRFKLTEDVMLYARLASGYRPGGPNTTVTPGSGLPMSFGPDKTQNYEVGFKGSFWDHLLTLDASVYYIKWKDMQINVSDTAKVESYATNLGQAKSQGAELSVDVRPAKGLTVSAWGSWDNAVLTQAFPADSSAVGAVGDRLPYSARFSGALTIKQEAALANDVLGFAAVTLSYVGKRQGEFSAGFGGGRQDYPAYTKADVRVGATYETWSTNLYVNNVSDQRGLISGGLGTLNPNAFTLIQPRTIGLSVSKTF